MIGDALDRLEHVEEVVCTHVYALNEDVHQMLEEQEERFRAKEAKLKKKLKIVKKRVGRRWRGRC